MTKIDIRFFFAKKMIANDCWSEIVEYLGIRELWVLSSMSKFHNKIAKNKAIKLGIKCARIVDNICLFRANDPNKLSRYGFAVTNSCPLKFRIYTSKHGRYILTFRGTEISQNNESQSVYEIRTNLFPIIEDLEHINYSVDSVSHHDTFLCVDNYGGGGIYYHKDIKAAYTGFVRGTFGDYDGYTVEIDGHVYEKISYTSVEEQERKINYIWDENGVGERHEHNVKPIKVTPGGCFYFFTSPRLFNFCVRARLSADCVKYVLIKVSHT